MGLGLGVAVGVAVGVGVGVGVGVAVGVGVGVEFADTEKAAATGAAITEPMVADNTKEYPPTADGAAVETEQTEFDEVVDVIEGGTTLPPGFVTNIHWQL